METVITKDLLEVIKRIEPNIRKHSFETEKNRQLSGPVIDVLKENGIFRTWRPLAYGGLESDPITGFRVMEELSRIDSAVGWNVNLSFAIEMILQWFSDEALAEVYGIDDELILAGSWNPPGQANPVDGGYEVSGQWNIVSGCLHAHWIMVNAMIMEDGMPKMLENGHPDLLLMLVPSSEASVVDTWNTIGMKGTGSHDIKLDQVFIPDYRSAPMVPIGHAKASAFQGPLYHNTVWYGITGIAAPALGIARAAVDDSLDLIRNKIPNYTETILKDLQDVQMKLAEAEATLGAARAYVYSEVQSIWESAQKGNRIQMGQKMGMQMAGTYAVDACAKAVNLVHDIAGLTGMRDSHPLQRHFRDIHTIRQHAFISKARYQAVGQLLLDLEPNWGFFYF